MTEVANPRPTLTSEDVAAAASRLRPYVRRTPLLRLTLDGRPLVLKLEQLQLSGSFKLRGAMNAMLAGNVRDHIVTASGGNHGLGVATAASLLGLCSDEMRLPLVPMEGENLRVLQETLDRSAHLLPTPEEV